jgi:hypothetical protein
MVSVCFEGRCRRGEKRGGAGEGREEEEKLEEKVKG